jgi:GNAT superfamily N-acetyltransferase
VDDHSTAPGGRDPAPGAHAAAAALLHREFHDDRFTVPGYLRWLYDENPAGRAIALTRGDEAGALAHYALVPQRWCPPAGEPLLLGITLDAVVRADAQRRGLFRELATEVYERAAAAGVQGTITVANASSEPAFTRYLGFRSLGSLPVVALAPGRRARGIVTHRVEPALLAGSLPDELAGAPPVAALTGTPAGLVQEWSADLLRWRLSNPAGRYALHVADDVAAVSSVHRVAGVPVAVIVKLLPRGRTVRTPVGALVTAACRAHRAPAAVYAGWNAHVPVRGVALPRRLLPSPLHLLVRGFAPAFDATAVSVATYEFLDADHY